MEDRQLLDQPHQDQDELRENTARIAEEFYEGFQAVERIDRPAVSIFGSARIDEDSPEYATARATGRLFGEAGWAVITGGGPGAMEAVNKGMEMTLAEGLYLEATLFGVCCATEDKKEGTTAFLEKRPAAFKGK